MLDNIEWNIEPHYGLLTLSWTMTLTATALIWNIVSYLKSKLPLQSTIMDFVTICLMALLQYVCLLFSIMITTMTFISDCGDTIATAMAWTVTITCHTIQQETLPLVSLQVICTIYPWILESSAFEKIYKLVVLIVMPSISVVIVLAVRDSIPQFLWYKILRGQGSSIDSSTHAIVSFVSISYSVFGG